jgi:hypothetical protein
VGLVIELADSGFNLNDGNEFIINKCIMSIE